MELVVSRLQWAREWKGWPRLPNGANWGMPDYIARAFVLYGDLCVSVRRPGYTVDGGEPGRTAEGHPPLTTLEAMALTLEDMAAKLDPRSYLLTMGPGNVRTVLEGATAFDSLVLVIIEDHLAMKVVRETGP